MRIVNNRKMNFIFLISWFCSGLVLATSDIQSGPCHLDELFVCSANETCKQISSTNVQGHCECKLNFIRLENGAGCIQDPKWTSATPPPSASKPTSLPNSAPVQQTAGFGGVVWVVVVSCVVLGTLGALVLVGKRFRWLERLHHLRLRHYNTVLVSSINDDDAPIQ